MSNNSSSNNLTQLRLLSRPVRPVSEEEFRNWELDPVTVAFKAYLRNKLNGAKSDWVAGKFTHPSAEGTAQINARALGYCEVIQEILDLPFSFINEGVSND